MAHELLRLKKGCLAELLFNQFRQPLYPFIDLFLARVGKIQPHGVVTATVEMKSRSDNIGNFLFDGFGEQLTCIHAFGQGQPKEKSSFWMGPIDS